MVKRKMSAAARNRRRRRRAAIKRGERYVGDAPLFRALALELGRQSARPRGRRR